MYAIEKTMRSVCYSLRISKSPESEIIQDLTLGGGKEKWLSCASLALHLPPPAEIIAEIDPRAFKGLGSPLFSLFIYSSISLLRYFHHHNIFISFITNAKLIKTNDMPLISFEDVAISTRNLRNSSAFYVYKGHTTAWKDRKSQTQLHSPPRPRKRFHTKLQICWSLASTCSLKPYFVSYLYNIFFNKEEGAPDHYFCLLEGRGLNEPSSGCQASYGSDLLVSDKVRDFRIHVRQESAPVVVSTIGWPY